MKSHSRFTESIQRFSKILSDAWVSVLWLWRCGLSVVALRHVSPSDRHAADTEHEGGPCAASSLSSCQRSRCCCCSSATTPPPTAALSPPAPSCSSLHPLAQAHS